MGSVESNCRWAVEEVRQGFAQLTLSE